MVYVKNGGLARSTNNRPGLVERVRSRRYPTIGGLGD